MSFQDLPDNVRGLPLTDERLVADVLDLLITPLDRARGCLLVAICDEQSRLVQPCMIDDVPAHPDGATTAAWLNVFAEAMEHFDEPASAIVALGRRDGLSVSADDLPWVEAVECVFRGRLGLRGVYICTDDGSRPVPKVA